MYTSLKVNNVKLYWFGLPKIKVSWEHAHTNFVKVYLQHGNEVTVEDKTDSCYGCSKKTKDFKSAINASCSNHIT